MIKKTMAASLLLASVANPTHAASLINTLVHSKTAMQDQAKNSQAYTDFNGQWKSAKCMGMELDLRIEHTEEVFSMDGGKPFRIGSMATEANSGVSTPFTTMAESEITSVEWNDDKTQLIMKGVSVTKSFSHEKELKGAAETQMLTILSNVVLAIDNGQLKITFGSVTYQDLQRVDSAKPTCVFTKVDANA